MRISDWSSDVCSSDLYFRNTIRRVLQTSDPASIRDTTIDLGGERVAATEISFRPFANDPNRARLREFADKSYHVIISDAVPGGIYEVQAETPAGDGEGVLLRATSSEEHTSELQSLMRISYAVFCLKKKNITDTIPR